MIKAAEGQRIEPTTIAKKMLSKKLTLARASARTNLG
jgi:hypothetical protein